MGVSTRQVRCNVKPIFFFCLLWYPSHVSQGIRLLVPQVVGYGKAFDANDHTITSGLSSMTKHLFQHFMVIQKPECHSPFSTFSPDLVLCDFFSLFPKKNSGWKAIISTWLKRSRRKHKRCSSHSHLRTTSNAWNLKKKKKCWHRWIHAQGKDLGLDGRK